MSELADHYVERIHLGPSRATKSIKCKHCDFYFEMSKPTYRMGNFGRVSTMRKRMRDHIKEVHPELPHSGKGG